MSISLLMPDTDLLHLDAVSQEEGGITLELSTIQTAPCCPTCGEPASRVHSAYMRSPADLPCGGVPLRLQLHARRFHCDATHCPRRIFTERLPGLLPPYARRTLRLTEVLAAVAYALGGAAGARLTERLGMPASRDTLLRRLKETPPAHPTPRVLGVDDWAKRKGKQYGTILVDLERRCVIDLLPDRLAETLAVWLKEHPGVEIIARDRGGAYAQGAREGAPEAVQVADRWHLLQNLAQTLEAALAHEQQALQEAANPPVAGEGEAATPPASGNNFPASPPPKPLNRAQRESAARRARRKELFEAMKRLYAEGYSITAIAQKLSKSRNTVHKYLKMDAFPENKQQQGAPGPLVPYQSYLARRWQEGCHNAAQLWREIRERGFGGACSVVQQDLSEWRTKLPTEARRTGGRNRKDALEGRAPAPRAVVWWLLGEKEKLTEEQAAFLGRLKERCPKVEIVESLAREFFGMVRRREAAGLKGWIERAVASGIEPLKSFGEGLRRDGEAVEAGLRLEWSNGLVEGQVNRLKMIKRQMFGRAGLAVLRARIVPAAKAA